MIKVLIETKKVVVSGHANYAKKGNDIVCASVSTAVMMSINQIEIFDLLDCIEYNVDNNGLIAIEVVKENDTVLKIIKNLVYTLSDLELQYPKYIKINENL